MSKSEPVRVLRPAPRLSVQIDVGVAAGSCLMPLVILGALCAWTLRR